MKFNAKMWITDEKKNEKFFGKGPYDILKRVEELGSLNKAAKDMHMSYSKAFNVIKRSEKILGKPLIISEIGGSKGGGSELTEYAIALLKIYVESEKILSDTLNQLNEKYRDWEKGVSDDE